VILAGNFTGGQFPDLLFYDRAAGVGEIYSTDGQGNIALVISFNDWRTSWTQIVNCNITGGQYDDLLFYEGSTGYVEIYTTDGNGNITLLSGRGMPTGMVIRVFAFAELLFYFPLGGIGQFNTIDSTGNLTWLKDYGDWRKTWSMIIPGNFS
jgi:hypothetical protein